MPRNRRELTGSVLAGKYGRAPGDGRYKKHLYDVEAQMEKQEQKAAKGTMRDLIQAQLATLRMLIRPRSADNVRKAGRAK